MGPFDHDENENYAETTILGKNDVKVAGWGATHESGRNLADALQKLRVPIFPIEKCVDKYKTGGVNLDEVSQMCAGGEAGKDSCGGDSGSGLMREEKIQLEKGVRGFKYRWKLLGLVSFGPRICGGKGVPAVYARMRHYLDWVLENIHA